ncbi:sigma-70 family RNA polymerase sigma factor [Amycolatopsis sp. NPDC059027]|uniref:sigma-70 family RNA polymerase sigma factor n=1 Tax=Amycolatopsis sp. NPDC059027 TaxID=3346709 RepID=UPI003671A2D1
MAQRVETAPDHEDFARHTEQFRRELLAHCYRVLGTLDEAEDLVQETYLRAWRAYDRFEGRSSIRTWLYRIATNACLTALEHRGRRPLPSGLGAPATDPDTEPELAPGIVWLQPIPADPATVVAERDTLRLALVASLQHLPARQRVVLILRDVLAWPAADVAELLGTSTAAVKSTLQRARARMDEVAPAADQVTEPTEPQSRALLEQYISAFENADPTALERILREDAVLEVTPSRTWFSGRATCLPYLTRYALGAPGDWRMLPVSANGQPAAVAYRLGEDGAHHVYGVAVLTTSPTGLARITVFGDPGLAARFGCPDTLPR